MVRSIRSVLAAGLLLAATAGTTYAAVPTNDAVETPETISGTPYTNTQDTTEATSNATDPECFDPSPTVWYAYTPADTGWLAADTFGSDYDTTLAVLGPDGNGGYEIIDCNDDTDSSVQSRVRLEAQGGVTYLFMVGAFGGGPAGSLVFNLDTIPAPVQLDLSVSVAGTGHFLKDGSAIVGLTVTCNIPASAWINVELVQQVGRFSVHGWGETSVECGPDPTHLSVAVVGEGGKFAGGPATARVYGEAWSPEEDTYDDEFVPASVRLRK
jgi:hypothetical protein